MNHAIPSKDDPALRALLATAGRTALEAVERERTERRAAVLAAHRLRTTAAMASEATALSAIGPLRDELATARLELNRAAAALRDAEADVARIGDAREALTNRLCVELADLGHQAVIQATEEVAHVLHATMAAGEYQVRHHFNARARRAGPTFDLDDGGTPQKVDRLRAALRQLEDLRFTDQAPAAIEARCSALVTWAKDGAKTPMPGEQPPQGFLARVVESVKGALA